MKLENMKPTGMSALRAACLLVLLVLIRVLALGQAAVINGIVPASGPYCHGSTIRIYGDNIFDVTVNNCDSLIATQTIPPGPTFRYRANNPPFFTSGSYSGFDHPTLAGPDTIRFVIPCTWPAGTYSIIVHDDEDCNGGNYSAVPLVITVTGPGCIPNLNYSSDTVFCLGDANPMPTGSYPAGTFVDIDATPGANAVGNASTGQLALHSGWADFSPHRIVYTSTSCGLKDTVTVRLRPTQTPTLSYDSAAYCKSNAFIPAPTLTPSLPGTFTINPTGLTGFVGASGAVTISSGTAAGTYLVTWTSSNSNDCAVPATDVLTINNLDSAIFSYNSVYCPGDPSLGFPSSIGSLPGGGGNFVDEQGLGLVFVSSVTGQINLTTSPQDTFVVAYIPTSTCRKVKRDTLIVRSPAPSSFSVVNPVVCSNEGIQTLFLSTPTAGTFSSTGNFVFFTDNVLGVIDPAQSTPGGPYAIIRTNGDAQCPATSVDSITIRPPADDSISYGATAFCKNDADPTPFLVRGLAGGDYHFIVGSGTIDSVSGIIDLQNTPTGTYTIGYATSPLNCVDTTSFTLTINPAPTASFALVQDTFCQNSGDYSFTSSPSGGTDTWSIRNAADSLLAGGITTTTIHTNALPSGGPFQVVLLSQIGACLDSMIDFITILPEEDASFVYIPDSFCKADQNPLPAILGTGAGSFYCTNTSFQPDSQLVVNQTSGMIDLLNCLNGVGYVLHITSGACPDSSLFPINILDANSPFFTYTRSVICETFRGVITADDIGITDSTAYFFSCSPPWAALDTSSGDLTIDSTTAIPGTYQVTMQLRSLVGACQSDWTVSITVDSTDNTLGSLTFTPGTDSVFCRNEDSAQAVLAPNGLFQQGRFYSSPSNLAWLNRDSGTVSLVASPPNTYQIYFVLNNACRDTIGYSMVIDVPEPIDLWYENSVGDSINEFCPNDPLGAFAFSSSTSNGIFTFSTNQTNDTLYFVDNTTGQIDLSNSSSGNYTITFDELSGCSSTAQVDIEILTGPVGTRIDLFPSDEFCLGDSVQMVCSPNSGEYTFVAYRDTTILDTNRIVYVTDFQDQDTARFVITDRDGCTAIEEAVVTGYPVPSVVPIGVPGTISGSDPILFWLGTTAPQTTFYWTASGSGSVSFDVDGDSIPGINPGQTGQISVIANLASGYSPGIATFQIVPRALICTGDTTEIVVRINPSNTSIFVPEVFTPGVSVGDNDTWLIQWRSDIDPTDFVMQVFNRAGGEVKYMDGLSSDWAAEEVPDGVYFWVLTAKGSQSVVDKGAVTIRRR